MREGERTPLRTSAKIKPALFRGIGYFQKNHQQSTEENALCLLVISVAVV